MGLCAWTGDAQNNPQMAMKPLSFKLRFLESRTLSARMIRVEWPALHVDE